MVGPTGQVAAFEPNPMSFARLCRHQKMNRITWLKLYQAAASDISGKGELLTNGNLDSTSTHLRYDDEVQDGQSNPIGIAVVRIDDLVEKGEMRLPHFIKIDVEGHGHKAVLGMRNSIEKSRPSMIIGFHSRAEVDGILDVLKPMGYRWEAVVAPESNADSLIGGDYLFTAS
jgi:FkbM family methyltransferase